MLLVAVLLAVLLVVPVLLAVTETVAEKEAVGLGCGGISKQPVRSMAPAAWLYGNDVKYGCRTRPSMPNQNSFTTPTLPLQ
jgi:hypothetical protein